MHETTSNNFAGYIDNLYIHGNNLRLSGWLVTTYFRDDVTYYVDQGNGAITIYNYNERQDVADFYQTKNESYTKCGFDVDIPNSVNDQITIFADINGIREDIFTLSKSLNRTQLVEHTLADEPSDIKIRSRLVPEILVVDNFYEDPDATRQLALSQDFRPDLRYHKGYRTDKQFLAEGTKQVFESLLGRKITRWSEYNYNGIFQYCTAEDPLVYHSDMQSYAAAIYLTPDAPIETGTSFFRSKANGARQSHVDDANYNETFKGGFYDKTQFEMVDTVGNVYNRLVIWNSKLIHSAAGYFGTDKGNSRLFHLFFFDIEDYK
jgi:hypothetical protein